MAGVIIRGGEHVDIPTAAEIRQIFDVELRAQLRGMKDIRRSTLLTTPAGTRVTTLDGITPAAGYKWVVRLLSVFLASAGTGQAFITSDTASTLSNLTQSKAVAALTTSTTIQVATFPQGACVLDEGEGLYLNFTQNITGYMVAGWEVPAEMIGKLA